MKNFKLVFLLLSLIIVSFVPAVLKGQAQPAVVKPTGNPILDAPLLRVAIDSGRKQDILNIISAHWSHKFKNYADMRESIDSKVAEFLVLPPANNTSDKQLGVTQTVNPQTNAGSQGLPLPSSAVDALSTFLADRFKQEIEIAFLDNFRTKLKSINELRALFPQTLTVLEQNDPYQYTTFLESLKEALNKDLKNLPTYLGNYLATDPYNLGSKTPFYFPSIIAYQNTLRIIQGQPALGVLDTLDQESLVVNKAGDYGAYLRLLAVICRTITNPATSSPTAIGLPAINTTFKDVNNTKMFLGLLMIKEKDALQKIVFNKKTLYDLFTIGTVTIPPLQSWCTTVFQDITNLDQSAKNIYNQLNAIKLPVLSSQINDFSNTLITTINDIAVTFPYGSFKIDTGYEHNVQAFVAKITADIKTVSTTITTFGNITTEITDKNYGLALSNAIIILNAYLPPDCKETIGWISKYGNFAVSVIKSQSSADMEQALSTAALPVGSYRIKRNSIVDISLNAYAGLGGGIQWYSKSKTLQAGVNSTNNTLGFTAPVGVAISFGSTKNDKPSGSSYTIFLSAIDVGAVTSFRLTHDASSTLPNFSWQNIIAPGGYFVYGVKKSPVSIGGGVQYGPQLRSISDNTANILPSAWNARIFVAIDIPIFSFYSKAEREAVK